MAWFSFSKVSLQNFRIYFFLATATINTWISVNPHTCFRRRDNVSSFQTQIKRSLHENHYLPEDYSSRHFSGDRLWIKYLLLYLFPRYQNKIALGNVSVSEWRLIDILQHRKAKWWCGKAPARIARSAHGRATSTCLLNERRFRRRPPFRSMRVADG